MTRFNALRTSVAAAAAAAAMTLFAAPLAAETLSLRISSENTTSTQDVVMAQRFIDALKEELGDDFQYELFHTKALGDEVVHMQMIRTGQIDVYPAGSDAVQLDPSLMVFELPFLFQDRDAIATALDGELGELLRESLRERAGVELLSFGEIGFRQIINNVRPVVKPEDLAALKLRVPGSEARLLTFTALGSSPVTMGLSELYLALQQGTVDGQEGPLKTIKVSSFHEVTRYLSVSNHIYTPLTFMMNGAKFDSLSPEHQDAVKRAATVAAKYSRELGAKDDVAVLAELRGPMEVTEIDFAAFQEASRPIWEEIGKLIGPEFLAQALPLVQPTSN